eukprot:6901105-Lingulodinium_polyedra.AAC.1
MWADVQQPRGARKDGSRAQTNNIGGVSLVDLVMESVRAWGAARQNQYYAEYPGPIRSGTLHDGATVLKITVQERRGGDGWRRSGGPETSPAVPERPLNVGP